MHSRRRTIRRAMQSRLVKKKSPTSASPRSMSSTRRTQRRLRTAYRLPGAVAVVVAVAEVAVAAAVVPEAAVVAAVAVAAVCPGVAAVFAKHETPTYLISASVMAGSDKIDPANPCPGCGAAFTCALQRLQILPERLCDFFENASARTGCKNSGGRRTWPRGRSGVVSKMHVLTL
jgi:hypothetical protein